ncbi:hypothetical protein N7447_008360 [Penicillium robsamsonii]|uniref:uncharacterized protein n=1 Tax=Penicillium robsamsonii TaxID=1792511 RepID=UPI00254670C3|nr:uncharacterized protein N7447_008360 [Penicillium robsamsonii]KAJ5816127.1 hypothetical protein N7447_008360 [Penicillium robsamsonii]
MAEERDFAAEALAPEVDAPSSSGPAPPFPRQASDSVIPPSANLQDPAYLPHPHTWARSMLRAAVGLHHTNNP